LLPDAHDRAGQQAQHAHGEQRVAAFHRQARVLPHEECGVAHHEHQVAVRAGLYAVPGLDELLLPQLLAVDECIAAQVHHVAALLRHRAAEAAHGGPGGGRLEEAAAARPLHLVFGASLQCVMAHGLCSPPGGTATASASPSAWKLSRKVKYSEVENIATSTSTVGSMML